MSGLRQAAQDYLALRRAVGFKLDEPGRVLPDFVSYMEQRGATTVTINLAVGWAQQHTTSADAAARKLAVVRGFAHYLQAFDADTEVPPVRLLPRHRHRPTPYLYSAADIEALMDAAGALRPPLKAATYQTLLGLLAVSGLRVGEAFRLDRADIDWDNSLLNIRDTKFHKNRQVPLHASTMAALAGYDGQRRRLCPRLATAGFFVSTTGARLLHSGFHETFVRLLSTAGITAAPAGRRPRAHDLRHSFAVQTLLRWYRDGQDVEVLLPRLSVYLGHLNPAATFWYLSAAPELLALACERLANSHPEVRS